MCAIRAQFRDLTAMLSNLAVFPHGKDKFKYRENHHKPDNIKYNL